MAAFTSPFDESSVELGDDATITLPDPYESGDASIAFDDPITREGVARYAGSPLILMHVVPAAAGPFNLSSPVSGTVRRIALDAATAGDLNGTNELIEIEPLPFGISPTLQRIRPGIPTFYLGYSDAPVDIADFDFLEAGAFIEAVDDHAYLGVCFQDGSVLAPWEWIEILRRAVDENGDTGDADAWNELADLYGDVDRTLRILDHRGQPFEEPVSFTVSVNGQPETVVPTNDQSELNLAPGEVSLRWDGDSPAGESPLPMHARYSELIWNPDQDALSTPPGGTILLPSTFRRGHLQVLDLSSWFSQRPTAPLDPEFPALPRFHINSRVEPLIDGVESFKYIVSDLLASNVQGCGGHFSGLIFNDFPLDEGKEDASGEIDTTLTGLTKYVRDGGSGGDVRMMFSKFLQLKDAAQFSNTVERALLAVCLLSISAATVVALRDELHPDEAGYKLLWGTGFLFTVLIDRLVTGENTTEFLEGLVEKSLEVFNELNAADADDPDKPMLAVWGRYPVTMRDNPLANLDLLPGFNIAEHQDRFGSWHQKIQAIKRTAPGNPEDCLYVGYAGGIDINKNRLNSPGHQTKSPYHDVHVRVTGGAAWDIHQTWIERYKFETEQYADIDGVTLPPPAFDVDVPGDDPEAYPSQAAKHIVQTGRTYAKPSGTGMAPLAFALDGEQTIYETYLRAIKNAREYIYLEDQYFAPNTGSKSRTAGDPALPIEFRSDPDVFVDVLIEASYHCKRLVVTVPRAGDQPFGHERRAVVLDLLQARWGDRMFAGVPLRRPLLSPSGRTASKGRCLLLEAIGIGDPDIKVGPAVRLPGEPPFWLWIYGELMLCTRFVEGPIDVNGVPGMVLRVERGPSPTGSDPRWGALPRAHKAGAPVTLAQPKGPYVHAKVMLVDDIFMAVGSANLNRRSFFNDGEIQVFTVPEQLKAAPENPALALRTALWAEHLGIPPTMGPSLLADPIAGYEYFRRSRYQGNRSAPVKAINERPVLGGAVGGTVFSALKNLLGASAILVLDDVWNTLSDPTTTGDPDRTAGPFK